MTQSLWILNRELVRVQLNGFMSLPDLHYLSLENVDMSMVMGHISTGDDVINQKLELSYWYKGESKSLGQLTIQMSTGRIRQRAFDNFY